MELELLRLQPGERRWIPCCYWHHGSTGPPAAPYCPSHTSWLMLDSCVVRVAHQPEPHQTVRHARRAFDVLASAAQWFHCHLIRVAVLAISSP